MNNILAKVVQMTEELKDKFCPHCKLKMVNTSSKICKPCKSSYDKLYILKNKKLISEKRKKYREKNRDRIILDSRRRYSENREQILAKRKEDFHPLQRTYTNILTRCYNKNNFAYQYYGGRGIKVCDRWLGKNGFKNFIEDMGPRPGGFTSSGIPEYSIDRYPDKNGNYEPNNCRWATKKEQSINRRSNLEYRKNIPDEADVVLEGRTISLRDFSEKTSIHLEVLKDRYAKSSNIRSLLGLTTVLPKWTYKGNKYSIPELSIISKVPKASLRYRLIEAKWPIERAMSY